MKSFIVALILICSVTVFIIINAGQTVSAIDEMLALAESLPQNVDIFDTEYENIQETVYSLCLLWDKKFPYIAFTAGYENTNRCDEAIGSIRVHFENRNGTDFTVARAEFCDCLDRLRILEGFHLQGIF